MLFNVFVEMERSLCRCHVCDGPKAQEIGMGLNPDRGLKIDFNQQ